MGDFLSKYIIKKKTEDVIHSSAYAEAQNRGGIGTASTQSFNDRMKIEENRSRIQEYNDSRVVTQARASSGIKAKVYTLPEQDNNGNGNGGRVQSRIGGVRQSGLRAGSTGDTNFRPPTRKNPGISR